MSTQDSFDVIVVGSGVGGLATALAATASGLRPLVLEKAAKIGGGTSFSNGGIWIGDNHLARDAGYKDSREATREYMKFVAGDQADEDRLNAYVDRGPEALKFFEDLGVRFRISIGLKDHYFGIAPGAVAEGRCLNTDFIAATELGDWRDSVLIPRDSPIEVNSSELFAWGGVTNMHAWPRELLDERRRKMIRARGPGVITHFLKQLLARGASIRCNSGVERLIVEAGKVVGVALADGAEIRAARGVALACGAYESNPDMAKLYEGLPGWLSMFPPSIEGDAIAMATAVGGYVRVIHNNLALFLGFNIPGKVIGEEPLFRLVGISEMCCPHTIVVNRDGRRFADETYFQAMAPALRRYDVDRRQYANLPCYLVFDQQYVDGFSFADRPRGAPPPDWVARADTLDALAQRLGVDAAGLGSTVERFNGFARAGVDGDFARGQKQWTLAKKDLWAPTRADERYIDQSLGTLRYPPFYGVELHPSAFASAGLVADDHARVLNHRGLAIPGLYAVGNSAAHTEYGVGYQAGYSLGSGMTFGYLAARHMAGLS